MKLDANIGSHMYCDCLGTQWAHNTPKYNRSVARATVWDAIFRKLCRMYHKQG